MARARDAKALEEPRLGDAKAVWDLADSGAHLIVSGILHGLHFSHLPVFVGLLVFELLLGFFREHLPVVHLVKAPREGAREGGREKDQDHCVSLSRTVAYAIRCTED